MLAQISFDPIQKVLDGVAESIPGLLGGLAILLLGVFLSGLAGKLVRAFVQRSGIEVSLEKIGATEVLYKLGYKNGTATLVGTLVTWAGYLIALVLASEAIGLSEVSDGLQTLVAYLPRATVSILFLLVGFWAAQLAKSLISNLTRSDDDLDSPQLIGVALYYVIIAVTVALSADQLGLETAIINGLIQIVVAAFCFGAALAFGLGARDTAHNIVARSYVSKQFHRGDRVQVRDKWEGVVRAHAPTNLVISTDDGDITVPYSIFMNEVVRIDEATQTPVEPAAPKPTPGEATATPDETSNSIDLDDDLDDPFDDDAGFDDDDGFTPPQLPKV